jgi:uncharacterized NAD-dependent epimerase/dehydratase family protein
MKPYVILAEGRSHDPQDAKTMHGILRYGDSPTVAIVDSRRPGESIDGVPIVATMAEAMAHGPERAIVGVAPAGGVLDDAWLALIESAIDAGLDVQSGLHTRIAEQPRLVAAAARRGVTLTDLRHPPSALRLPTGANLTLNATVVHTVGSDCAIGKKTMALEMHREALERGCRSVFVPTGQTGVAIAGWGIAIDAVPADFIAGAAEQLVVEGATKGDLLWVEGQGAIVHPDYSGVTLGLYHGCAPDLLVLCHRAGDTHLSELPAHPILPLTRLIEIYETVALPVKPARVVAIALNTQRLASDDDARAAIAAAEAETGLPAGDPVRFSAGPIVDAVLAAARPVRQSPA